MKKEKISQALGNIHTKFLKEAEEYKGYGQKVWRKWGTVAASFAAVFICLSILAVGFGPNGFFNRQEQEMPTVGTSTLTPTHTAEPTPTPNLEKEFLGEELLSQLQQGLFKDCKLLKYEEQSGIAYDYITFVFQMEEEDGYAEIVKVVAVFSKGSPLIKEIIYVNSEGGLSPSHLDENYMPVIETDVNFDGKLDVLIFKGHPGTSSSLCYTCYLGTDDGLVYFPIFEKIKDPVINTEKQIIQSFWGEGTIFYTGEIYRFVDGELIKTESLVVGEKQDQDEDYNPYCVWTLKKLVDGEMVVIETFSDKGLSDAEKEELIEPLKSFDSYYVLTGETVIPPIGIYYDYMIYEKKQGEFSAYKVESYVEEMGTEYNYATLLLAPQTAGLNPIKMVGVFDGVKKVNILYEEAEQETSFTVEPTSTPSLEEGISNEELLSALQHGVFGSHYEVLLYEEQVGTVYNYATFVCRVELFGDAEFVKVVAVFEKDNGSLKEIIYIDSEGGFTLYNLGENYIPIKEADVNFDGKKDILIFKGNAGKEGYQTYTCYLGTDDGIVYCPEFEEIADPVIHTDKQIIQSGWQNNIASRTGLVYQYIDGELVDVEYLTWSERTDEDGNFYNEWVLERPADGELVVIETFSDKGMSETEKAELLKTLKTLDSYAPIVYYE